MNNVYRSTFKDGSHLSVDADVEFYRRTKLLEVAVKNPNAFEQITKNNINLFHGTNINALPSILKYGLLSKMLHIKTILMLLQEKNGQGKKELEGGLLV